MNLTAQRLINVAIVAVNNFSAEVMMFTFGVTTGYLVIICHLQLSKSCMHRQ